jgi:RND superfamily putative drug exporter
MRSGLMSGDGQTVLFEIVPAASVKPAPGQFPRSNGELLARDLMSADAAALTGLAGAGLRIGGLPALDFEYEQAVMGRFWSVVFLVVGVTGVALFIGFRSVLIAVKALVLNLLSVAAAFGALVLVFQDGYGASLVGLEGPTGGVFALLPVIVFCMVFGLSMDYEVILVARVAEARRSGMDETAAIAEGVARTGRVITSAAAIMVAVFAAFAIGGFLPVKMLGFALSVAVLLDATLVRMVIGPALLRIAGRWNWWPGAVPGSGEKRA